MTLSTGARYGGPKRRVSSEWGTESVKNNLEHGAQLRTI